MSIFTPKPWSGATLPEITTQIWRSLTCNKQELTLKIKCPAKLRQLKSLKRINFYPVLFTYENEPFRYDYQGFLILSLIVINRKTIIFPQNKDKVNYPLMTLISEPVQHRRPVFKAPPDIGLLLLYSPTKEFLLWLVELTVLLQENNHSKTMFVQVQIKADRLRVG